MNKTRIILLFLFLSLLFWVTDSVIDYLFHYEESFVYVFIQDKRELSFRLIAVVFFLFAGIITARIFEKSALVQGRLSESEERYRSLVESTEDSIYLIDREYRYLFMNKRHQQRMGLIGDNYIGKKYADFHSEKETEEFKKQVDKVFKTGRSFQEEHKSERDRKFFLRTLSPVLDKDGTVTGVTIVSKDITRLKELEKTLHTLSVTDELTGLYNRRGFFTLAEQQLKLANRSKKGIYLLYADVNLLKKINDTYGHAEGDRALKIIASILKKNYRESDIIARIGGDEFVIIPVGTADDKIEVIRNRFYKKLDEYNENRDHEYPITISIGLSFYDPSNPITLEELIEEADRDMYRSKKTGKITP